MAYNELKNKLAFVVYGTDEWRLSIKDEDGRWIVSYDAHGQDVVHARRAVNNIISIIRCNMTLCIIHGYNNGTAIKEMLRKSNFGNRLSEIKSPVYNPGITWMQVAAA